MPPVKCPVCGKDRIVKKVHAHNPPCRNCSNRAKARSQVRNTTISLRWFTRCKHNARSRGIEFDLTLADILELYVRQKGRCALSGLNIGWAPFGRRHTASLDRIDNNRGYARDNVQLLHKDVNMMKHTHNQVYFINICRMIGQFASCA